MKGMPHTIKVERHGNELIVHLALLEGPHTKLPGGVLLHSEGWVDVGYGLKMFLVVATVNTTIRSFKTITDDKRSFVQKLLGRKNQPLLEDKS